MQRNRIITTITGLALVGALLVPVREAAAFCGFYVAGADASLYNNATVVVLMRDGTRTVLAMQNDYQGPPEDFALVIPVPVVLQEGDVKTLPKEVFERVDKLAAPRLVEYWEEDPCYRPPKRRGCIDCRYDEEKSGAAAPPVHGVTVEAEFVVGEYQIQILSAEDATGLDTWLREQKYNIPEGAEPILRPYVQSGMKFFVAKVDAQKVKFENGHAALSPLRFHYDSPDFSLPVRLGLINANGPQDLLIHILAKDRYKVANYPNVTIPTNLVVKDETRENFGRFYVALFDDTLNKRPGAVVTEYSWAASSCDPCPEPALTFDELRLLGADVLPLAAGMFDEQGNVIDEEARWRLPSEFVLTRLHARYDKTSLGEDLVFEQAPGLTGGTGMPSGGKLGQPTQEQQTFSEHSHNMFQARYAILHHWQAPLTCSDPIWDRWGYGKGMGESRGPAVAGQLAFVARDAKLEQFIAGEPPPRPEPPSPAEAVARKAGCNCEIEDSSGAGLAGLASLFLLGLIPRRRKTNQRKANWQ